MFPSSYVLSYTSITWTPDLAHSIVEIFSVSRQATFYIVRLIFYFVRLLEVDSCTPSLRQDEGFPFKNFLEFSKAQIMATSTNPDHPYHYCQEPVFTRWLIYVYELVSRESSYPSASVTAIVNSQVSVN